MFLANENFPKPSTLFLRSKGFDVKSIQEESPGISDPEVIDIARQDSRIILTFDSDYGELIFRYAKEAPPAVIFFREKGNTPLFAGEVLAHLLAQQKMIFVNAFTVIEVDSIRQRFYK
jgi:predicted nuclease of predicted toxin-antitoxin system